MIGRIVFILVIAAVIIAAISLAACAGRPPAPREEVVITKEVDRIVREKCPDTRPLAEPYPDDDDALAAIEEADPLAIFKLAAIYRAARALYRARLAVDDAQISGCAAAGVPQ
jgi:hypothetical protein